jgi:phosphatidylglycerophosphatase C
VVDDAAPVASPGGDGVDVVVAAWDFDGTIARRDVLLEFLARTSGSTSLARSFTRHAPALLRGERDQAKAAVFADVLRGLDAAAVADAGARFSRHVEERLLRPDALERIAVHRAEGHELVLVSASLDVYLAPLGARLGFDRVIAVRLDEDPAGRLTGEMLGGNVRGEAKARLLRAHIDERHAGRRVEVWAYGDSPGDLDLLAMADRPVWMGRQRKRPSSIRAWSPTPPTRRR